MSEYHNPVLLNPCIDALVLKASGTYADATFGGGGHSRAILERLSSQGRLLAFDRDEDAIANAPDDRRFTLIHNNFRFIHNYALLLAAQGTIAPAETGGGPNIEKTDGNSLLAGGTDSENWGEGSGEGKTGDGIGGKADEESGEGKNRGITEANCEGEEEAKTVNKKNEGTENKTEINKGQLFDGILADLGVSSHQFDTAQRGFSFRYSAPLDMRMNAQGSKTAADIVNSYTQEELEKIFRLYGELDNARRISQLIIAARSSAPILTTDDLGNAIAAALPSFASHKFLAKLYQALRIEVNDEMRSLEKFLQGATDSLKTGGRLVVITYHSLEDRMVKNFIRSGNIEGIENKDSFGRLLSPLKAINRKPILPDEAEIASNTRARSAKLRIAEKL